MLSIAGCSCSSRGNNCKERRKGQAVRHGGVEEHPPAPCYVSAVDGDALLLAGGDDLVKLLLLRKVTQLTHKTQIYQTFLYFFFYLFLLPEAPVQVKHFFHVSP